MPMASASSVMWFGLVENSPSRVAKSKQPHFDRLFLKLPVKMRLFACVVSQVRNSTWSKPNSRKSHAGPTFVPRSSYVPPAFPSFSAWLSPYTGPFALGALQDRVPDPNVATLDIAAHGLMNVAAGGGFDVVGPHGGGLRGRKEERQQEKKDGENEAAASHGESPVVERTLGNDSARRADNDGHRAANRNSPGCPASTRAAGGQIPGFPSINLPICQSV